MLPGESSCPDGSEYVWQRGVESLQGWVTAAQSWPLFWERKNHLRQCYEKPQCRNFDFRAKSSWEKIFIYVKNFLSGGFCSKVKIAACQVFRYTAFGDFFSQNKGQLWAAVTRPQATYQGLKAHWRRQLLRMPQGDGCGPGTSKE